MSSSPCPPPINPASSCAASELTGRTAPSCPARSRAIPRSFRCKRDLEPERVLVVDHPAAAIGQHPALRGAAAEGRDHLLDVEAGLDREHDAFRDAEVRPGEDHLVDGLHGLPGTDRADMGDGPAERIQDRPGVLHVPLVATDEDRQGRVAGALAAARDGRVDHAQPALAETRGEVPAP